MKLLNKVKTMHVSDLSPIKRQTSFSSSLTNLKDILALIAKETESRDYLIAKEKSAKADFYARLKSDKPLRDLHTALQTFIS